MSWLPVDRMPLGGALWLLIWLAAFGLLTIIGTTGWLLFLWIAQHVRIV